MSNTVYTPTKNNTQAGVEKVFALPQQVYEISANLFGDPLASGDAEKSIRTITTEIRGDVSDNYVILVNTIETLGSVGSKVHNLEDDVFGNPDAPSGSDLGKSLRTLIAELQDRVTALENQNQT